MISYQLYSSRNHGPLADTLSMLRSAGYQEVEGYGALLTGDPGALKAALDEAGLTMGSAHMGLDMLEGGVETAVALGLASVFAPHVMPADRPADAEGWRAFGARLAELGGPYEDAGITFGWHNHDFELAPLPDGSVPLDHILASGIAWEADLAWVVRGGADPLAWIDRHAERLRAVHVKDIAPQGEKADEDGWADPGTGTMDWRALTDRLNRLGLAHWVMEHDNPSDDARFARAGMDAAAALGMAR